jgi:tripartite-type tricarboxylate transporter receptor subunit TctC
MRMIRRRSTGFAAAVTAALMLTPAAVCAEPWPQRTVRVIVQVTPGSGVDTTRVCSQNASPNVGSSQ